MTFTPLCISMAFLSLSQYMIGSWPSLTSSAVKLDIYDSITVKSDLSKIASTVNTVYGEGQGSKRTVNIYTSNSFKVNIDNNYVYSNIKLKDNKNKLIKVSCRSNINPSSVYVYKGENAIVVEWPINSEKMLIYSQF